MATPAEIQLVYVFSALLGLGAVLLALFPALHHAWTFAASRRFVVVLIAVILILGIGAVLLVGSAISDPIYFLPIAFVVVLPYAVPAFETIYAASGLVGWSIAFVVVAFDL